MSDIEHYVLILQSLYYYYRTDMGRDQAAVGRGSP